MQCLRSKPATDIQRKFTQFNEIFELYIPNPWVPVVDGEFASDPFIPDYPENLIKSGKYRKIPVLIGGTSEEGILGMRELFHHPGSYSLFTQSLPLILFNRPYAEITENDKYLIETIKK